MKRHISRNKKRSNTRNRRTRSFRKKIGKVFRGGQDDVIEFVQDPIPINAHNSGIKLADCYVFSRNKKVTIAFDLNNTASNKAWSVLSAGLKNFLFFLPQFSSAFIVILRIQEALVNGRVNYFDNKYKEGLFLEYHDLVGHVKSYFADFSPECIFFTIDDNDSQMFNGKESLKKFDGESLDPYEGVKGKTIDIANTFKLRLESESESEYPLLKDIRKHVDIVQQKINGGPAEIDSTTNPLLE